jgi:hypothetical protein
MTALLPMSTCTQPNPLELDRECGGHGYNDTHGGTPQTTIDLLRSIGVQHQTIAIYVSPDYPWRKWSSRFLPQTWPRKWPDRS